MRNRRRLVALILVTCWGSNVWSVPKRTESYKDLIEKANNLSLQKDRSQAVNILVTAIRRETIGSVASREMKSALQDISGSFLGDKAQQLFELALSLRKNDLSQSAGKISEALRIEADNTTLIAESARLQIARGECAVAADSLTKARRWNPYDDYLQLAAAQAAVCQGDASAFSAIRLVSDPKKSNVSKFWSLLEIEKAAQEKAELRARELLGLLAKTENRNPEISYWSWRLEKDPSLRTSAAQKYLMSCKNISASLFRQYMLDPMLCRRMSEVEAFLKTAG